MSLFVPEPVHACMSRVLVARGGIADVLQPASANPTCFPHAPPTRALSLVCARTPRLVTSPPGLPAASPLPEAGAGPELDTWTVVRSRLAGGSTPATASPESAVMLHGAGRCRYERALQGTWVLGHVLQASLPACCGKRLQVGERFASVLVQHGWPSGGPHTRKWQGSSRPVICQGHPQHTVTVQGLELT